MADMLTLRGESSTGLSDSSLVSKALSIEGGNTESSLSVAMEFLLTINKWAPAVAISLGLNHLFPSLVPDLLACWWRLALGGCAVSTALVCLAVPQAIRLSSGALPTATADDLLTILASALPTQTCFKFVQYFSLRSIKRGLDSINPDYAALNTIISYGMTATIMQAAAYNDAIKRTYSYYGLLDMIFMKHTNRLDEIDSGKLECALRDAKVDMADARAVIGDRRGLFTLTEFKEIVKKSEELTRARRVSVLSMFVSFLRANVLPGLLFGFLRECGATGVGIVLRPYVQTAMAPLGLPTLPAKILSGILSGMTTSFMTQWLHNNALRAGNLAQTGTIPSSAAVFNKTWNELGFRMFYLNADRRVLSTATATTVLGLIDIFA